MTETAVAASEPPDPHTGTNPARKSAVGATDDPHGPSLPFSCRCGARWSGYRTCHCGAQCHATFAGHTGFDAHRRGGQCVDPATVGLVLRDRGYPVWADPRERPSDDYWRERGHG